MSVWNIVYVEEPKDGIPSISNGLVMFKDEIPDNDSLDRLFTKQGKEVVYMKKCKKGLVIPPMLR